MKHTGKVETKWGEIAYTWTRPFPPGDDEMAWIKEQVEKNWPDYAQRFHDHHTCPRCQKSDMRRVDPSGFRDHANALFKEDYNAFII